MKNKDIKTIVAIIGITLIGIASFYTIIIPIFCVMGIVGILEES